MPIGVGFVRGPGRPPGSRNKKTLEQIAAIKASGLTPLEYMLDTLRDEDLDPAIRMAAAVAAAPYVHARLTSTELKGTKDAPLALELAGSDVHG